MSILPTSTYSDGDTLYLGSTAGSITKTKPYAPNHLVYLGVITTASNGSAGRWYVRIQNGYELDEIHDVKITTPATGHYLYYDATTDPTNPIWKNSADWQGNTIPINKGGTGQTTQQLAINALAGGVTSGQYLRGNGTNVVMSAIQAADVPTLNQNTTGSSASLSISGQTGLLTFTGLTTTNRIKTLRDAADTILELGGSYTPTGTWNWTSATVTWPTFNQNTTGTAANVTGVVAVANGGTALTTIPAKSILLANTLDTYTTLTPGAGQSVRINATNTA